MGPVLFNVFSNDTDSGIEWTFSRLSDVVSMPERGNVIQKDLDKWDKMNIVRFNMAKCKVLHLACSNA